MADFSMYFPSKNEEKILALLMMPEHLLMTKKTFCHNAGVSLADFQEAMKNEKFLAHCEKMMDSVLREAMLPVTQALVREAKDGNFNHIKLFMEMTGKYSPKQNMELTGKNGGALEYMAMTSTQLKEAAKELLEEEGKK